MFVYPAVTTCITSYSQYMLFLPLYLNQSRDLQETSCAVKLFLAHQVPRSSLSSALRRKKKKNPKKTQHIPPTL